MEEETIDESQDYTEEDIGESQPEKKPSPLEEKIHFRIQGYSPEEIMAIENLAKTSRKTLAEAAEHPYIKAGMEAMRAKHKNTGFMPREVDASTQERREALKAEWQHRIEQRRARPFKSRF